jgi:[NiFe] hydrogenase large subunit/hydrogenase large subunit
MAVAHYLEALDWQRDFIKIHAVLGGKNPHLQSFLVGGMATPIDPDKQASINVTSISIMRKLISEARTFVEQVYIPDLLAVASFYKDWAGYGAGVGNYLVYGEYPEADGANAPLFFPAGVIRDRDLSTVEPFDPAKVTEFVTHSWYEYEDGDEQGLHPSRGETKPTYTGPEAPYERLNTDGKYSWLKAPRYDGRPMEVGPLSRMLVAYGSGHPRVRELVGSVLGQLGVGPEALFSTLGRVAARGIETLVLAEKLEEVSWKSTTTRSGIRRPGPRTAPGQAFMRRRGVPSDTGSTLWTARSPTTSVWCRALGTRGLATPLASWGPMKMR